MVSMAIGLLVMIIAVFAVNAIYFFIRLFLLKREIKRYEAILENVMMELSSCRPKINQIEYSRMINYCLGILW